MMPTPNDKRLEQAALYALGALGGKELQAFEKKVKAGCAVDYAVGGFQEVVEQLAMAAKPITPRADLRAKLFERIKNEADSSSTPCVSTRHCKTWASLSSAVLRRLTTIYGHFGESTIPRTEVQRNTHLRLAGASWWDGESLGPG